jgi:hypothetical protein
VVCWELEGRWRVEVECDRLDPKFFKIDPTLECFKSTNLVVAKKGVSLFYQLVPACPRTYTLKLSRTVKLVVDKNMVKIMHPS